MSRWQAHSPATGLTCDDLSTAELLVLLALRKRLEGRVDSGLLWNLFLTACGVSHVERAMYALESLFQVLRTDARRPLRLQPTVCTSVSHDEVSLLSLVAAYQRGHAHRAAALTRWLVPLHAAGVLAKHTLLLAHVLKQSEHLLPLQPGTAARVPTASRGGGEVRGSWCWGDVCSASCLRPTSTRCPAGTAANAPRADSAGGSPEAGS